MGFDRNAASDMAFGHKPVLLEECLTALHIKPDGVYVDGTLGRAGHSVEIAKRLTGGGRLICLDRDETAIAAAKVRLADYMDRVTLVHSNFSRLGEVLAELGVSGADGMLFDLGVSSPQLDEAQRGFSYMHDAPLDMRMNKRADKTAADIVAEYDEEALADIFYLYGELKNSRRIASALVKARQQHAIATTQDFLHVVEPFFKREREKKDMARLFQALRIEVNHEMEALKEMLAAATQLLAPGGRLSVITYHSLEDRIVKNVMKTGNAEGKMIQDFYGRIETPYRLVNNKVIVPTDEEQQRNPRSRSAKLRIAEKK